jgi:hypothetical protein
MKTITIVSFLFLAGLAFGQPGDQGAGQPLTVRLESEVEQLARGYAAAFTGITHTPIYLNLRREGATVTLVSIRSMKAVAGVLVVETDKGLTYVLNPKDIVSLTDAPPKKEP